MDFKNNGKEGSLTGSFTSFETRDLRVDYSERHRHHHKLQTVCHTGYNYKRAVGLSRNAMPDIA